MPDKLIRNILLLLSIIVILPTISVFDGTILHAQSNGHPISINYYPHKDIKNLNSSYTRCSINKDGLLFFANRDVLEYDGERWTPQSIKVNDYAISVLCDDHDDSIWVGSYGEIGVITKTNSGDKNYQSLMDKIPEEHQDLKEVWDIYKIDKDIFFIAQFKVLKWDGESFQIWTFETPRRILAHKVDNELYLHQRGTGLLKYEGQNFNSITTDSQIIHAGITAMIKVNQSIILGTMNNGLYELKNKEVSKFDTDVNTYLQTKTISSGLFYNNEIVLSTLSGGIVILNSNGISTNIITTDSKLSSNLVFKVYAANGSIWACTSTGISKINYPTPSKFIDTVDSEIVSSIRSHQDELYITSPAGLFRIQDDLLHTNTLKKLSKSANIYWSLHKSGNELYAGGHRGLNFLSNNHLESIHITKSTILDIKTSSFNNNIIYLATDAGFIIYDKQKNKAIFENHLKDISDSLNSITEDKDSNVWIGTSNKGLYQIKFAKNISSIEFIKNHLLDKSREIKQWAKVISINDKVYAITSDKIHALDHSNYKFKALNNIMLNFGSSRYDSIISNSSKNGDIYLALKNNNIDSKLNYNIWHLHSDNDTLKVTEQKIPHLNKLSSIYSLYIDKERETLWIGSIGKILRVDLRRDFPNKTYNTLIKQIRNNDDTVYNSGGILNKINPNDVNLKFTYATPAYPGESLRYQTKLDGFDNKWSKFTDLSFKEYTNLKHGNYTFKVRSKNEFGHLNSEDKITITILTPWYLTYWAFTIYFILLTCFIYLIIKWRTHQLKIKNIRLEETVKERTMLLQNANLKLADANRAKDEFLSNISHEIRNPMNAVVNLTKMVIKDKDLPHQTKENLNIIYRTGLFLSGFLNDLLDFNLIESKKVTINETTFNLLETCKEVKDIYESDAFKKNLTTYLDIDTNVNKHYIGDRHIIQQIVTNLYGNAVKFTQSGHVAISISGEDKEDSAYLKIAIQDTGPGIDQSQQKLIFDKFYQVEQKGKSKPGGTGIGLSLCLQRASLLNGEIALTSVPGNTTFSLNIPLKKASTGEINEFERNQLSQAEKIDLKVLVLDDEDYNRIIADDIFSEMGCIVDTCATSKEVFDLLEQNKYDIIFLDCNIKNDIGGPQICSIIRHKEISKASDQLPIIALTAYLSKKEQDECIHSGMNAIAGKPIKIEEIRNILLKYCDTDNTQLKENNSTPRSFISEDNIQILIKSLNELIDGLESSRDEIRFDKLSDLLHAKYFTISEVQKHYAPECDLLETYEKLHEKVGNHDKDGLIQISNKTIEIISRYLKKLESEFKNQELC